MRSVPLWSVTTWDKRFNGVERDWQKDVKKYNYLLADQLDSINLGKGPVRIMYTGKQIGYTSFELAESALSEGEIVAIPWGGIPRVQYYKGAFVTGDNRIATSSDTSVLLNKYLYYWMVSRIELISSFYRGASLKHPSMRDVLAMKISIPSLTDQKMIIEELDTILALNESIAQQIPLLDQQVKSLFNEMFGDPLDGKAKYKIGKAGDFGVAVDPQPSHRTPPEDPNGIPYVSIKDCQNGKVDFSKARLVGKHVLEEHKARYKLHKGDFIVGKIGTIGHPTFVPIEQNYTLSANIILIQPNPKLINPVYLYQAFKSEFVEHQYANEGGGTSQPAFGIQKFRNIDIIVPPLSVQNAFAERINQIDKLRFNFTCFAKKQALEDDFGSRKDDYDKRRNHRHRNSLPCISRQRAIRQVAPDPNAQIGFKYRRTRLIST